MCVNVNDICEKELILFSGKVVYNDNQRLRCKQQGIKLATLQSSEIKE